MGNMKQREIICLALSIESSWTLGALGLNHYFTYISVSSTEQCGATVMRMDLKSDSQVQAL